MAFENVKELWRFRELLYFLAWRDVKVRYKQAALGIAWAVLQPVVTMITFSFLFGKLANIPSNSVPYPLFSYSGLVLWTYFSIVLGQAGNSLVLNSNLITKVYFPRALLPIGAAIAGLFDLAIGMLFLLGMLIYYHVTPGWQIIFVPVALLQMLAVVLGISMLLGSLNVRYRDVKYAIPFLIQIWMFVTPIIYPVTFVPERWRFLLALNPMTGVVESFRVCLFGGNGADARTLGVSWMVTLILLAVGATYFRRTEREFADIV